MAWKSWGKDALYSAWQSLGKRDIESFNGKLRDELLNREVFYTLKEVQVLTEQWRQHYNQIRPHSSLGYKPPVPETILVNQTVHELVKLT